MFKYLYGISVIVLLGCLVMAVVNYSETVLVVAIISFVVSMVSLYCMAQRA